MILNIFRVVQGAGANPSSCQLRAGLPAGQFGSLLMPNKQGSANC